jgi:hypothetical protein
MHTYFIEGNSQLFELATQHSTSSNSNCNSVSLSEAEIATLREYAQQVIEKLPRMEPRLVQNKKKISR